jgi:hypothetical protein
MTRWAAWMPQRKPPPAAVPGAQRRDRVQRGAAVGAPGPVLRDPATRLRRGMDAAGSGGNPRRVRR